MKNGVLGWRHIVVCALFACLVTCTSPGSTERLPTPCLAPPHPEFLKYQSEAAAGRFHVPVEDGHPLGIIPSPVHLPHLKGQRIFPPQVTALPPSFDLRNVGKMPAVRNQSLCGTCWAFAAYSSMESCVLPAEVLDFSENHIKNTHGFDFACCDGADRTISAAYFSRWSGPAYEIDDPYNISSCTSPPGVPVSRHVQDIVYLPERSGPLDNDTIKQAVMTYGAIYIELMWDKSYYSASPPTYYCPHERTENHANTIVGWDDNYDKSLFNFKPAGNGAWIVANTWGTGWGWNGRYYMSYYDKSAPRNMAAFVKPESIANFSQVYQHDPLGWTASLGYGSETAWFANVFTANAAENLVAASWYSASPSSGYELRVYRDPSEDPLNPSGPVTSRTGTIQTPGYHTIPLGPVQLEAGQRFSIVVKQTTPGYSYPVPLEYPRAAYSTGAAANTGESYVSANGASWSDVTSSNVNTNVCLKAFTAFDARSIHQGKTQPDGGTIGVDEAVITAKFSDSMYVENADRSSGIRVHNARSNLKIAETIDVAGTIKTTSSGECYIDAFRSIKHGTGSIRPLCMTIQELGGGDLLGASGQKGVQDGCGLNNIGLLVRLYGRVAYRGSDYIYVEDGWTTNDGSGHPGVKVSAPGLSLPSQGGMVRVTGISSCVKSGTSLFRMVRATEMQVQ